MKAIVVRYPGSCDVDDLVLAFKNVGFNVEVMNFWENKELECDLVVIPGGASYGDYLRPGALSVFDDISKKVKDFAESGGVVLGIGNGFQILVENGLLPGGFLPNYPSGYVCGYVEVTVENNKTLFTSDYEECESLLVPISCKFGRYVKTSDVKVIFRFKEDLIGSDERIAGVCNKKGNVLGIIFHPERMMKGFIQGEKALKIFESIYRNLKKKTGE